MQDPDALAGVFLLVFFYVCGGLHGFSLGVLQPHRIRRVAGIVERCWVALRGDGETVCGLMCDRFHPCGRPGCDYVEDPESARAADAAFARRLGLGETTPATESAA